MIAKKEVDNIKNCDLADQAAVQKNYHRANSSNKLDAFPRVNARESILIPNTPNDTRFDTPIKTNQENPMNLDNCSIANGVGSPKKKGNIIITEKSQMADERKKIALILLKNVAEIEGIKTKEDKKIHSKTAGNLELVNKELLNEDEEDTHGDATKQFHKRKITRMKRIIQEQNPIDLNEGKRIKILQDINPTIKVTEYNDDQLVMETDDFPNKDPKETKNRRSSQKLTNYKKFDSLFKKDTMNDGNIKSDRKRRSTCFVAPGVIGQNNTMEYSIKQAIGRRDSMLPKDFARGTSINIRSTNVVITTNPSIKRRST